MTKETVNKSVQIITRNMLVHMVYMIEQDHSVSFIYVSNDQIDDKIVIEIENSIEDIIKKEVNILNAYEFAVPDRAEISKRADLIYCENKLIKQIFEMETSTAMKAVIEERSRIIERKAECSSYYLQ